MRGFLDAIRSMGRVLTFREDPETTEQWGLPHLIVGLLATWIVGIGRWWDDTRDLHVLQRLGLGSVAYVFALSLVLYAVLRPVARREVTWLQLLVFVTFVSPPAALYALPVELWTGEEIAFKLNLAFLAIVAAYRVALLVWFARKVGGLGWGGALVSTFAPLAIAGSVFGCASVSAMILDAMGGFRDQASETRAGIVGWVSLISWVLVIPLCAVYIAMVVKARRADVSSP